jgi:hypothetical protein
MFFFFLSSSPSIVPQGGLQDGNNNKNLVNNGFLRIELKSEKDASEFSSFFSLLFIVNFIIYISLFEIQIVFVFFYLFSRTREAFSSKSNRNS